MPAAAAPTARAAPAAAPAAPVAKPALPATPVVRKGGTLRYFPSGSIRSLDPVRNPSSVVREVMNNVYDFPVAWDQDLQPGLQMVESWSMTPDATEFNFTLRDGLLFHDGSPVEATDVASSMLRWSTSFSPSQIWEIALPEPSGVQAKILKLTMKVPFGLWMNWWAQFPTFVMRKETADSLASEDTNTDYIASGPYKLVEWNPEKNVILEKFLDYVSRDEPKSGVAGARPAYVDGIEFFEVPEAALRVTALQTGQVDVTTGVDADFYQPLLDDPNIKVSILNPFIKAELATNKTQPILANPKSRLAIQAAHDPINAMTAMYGDPDLYTVCPALWFCGSQWESDAGADLYWEVNLNKARRLWQEAVDESGFTGMIVLLATTDFAFLHNAALYTREVLEDMGVDVSFEVSDWAALLSRKNSNLGNVPDDGGWHFYETANPTAHDSHLDSAVGTSWNGGWDNATAQQLREDYLKAQTYAEAKAIVNELQRFYYAEDPSVINHGYGASLHGLRSDVFGYINFPLPCGYCDAVWLDR